MELALLVYVVDLITGLDSFLTKLLGFIAFLTCVSLVVGYLVSVIEKLYSLEDMWLFIKKYYPTKTLVVLLFTAWVIPSTSTIKYIATAYLVQTTFESEFGQETVTLSQRAIIKQLQVWAEEDTDVQQLLESVELPLPKTVVNKKETHNEQR